VCPEVDLCFPIADTHDVPQGSMLLGHILELVVVEIASQPDSCQYEYLPIVEPFASAIVSRVVIDIERDQVQDLLSECGRAVDVLQASQDGNDFVSAVEIELNLIDRVAIESLLIGMRFSHPFAPRR
jgi:hypothetical protein